MKCKNCKKEINDCSKKCSECQSDLRNWFFRHKILSIIIILFILGIIISTTDENEKNVLKIGGVDQNTGSIEEIVFVSSRELVKAYSDNEIAADIKYKNKIIEISGKVLDINNGIFDNEIIIILSGDKFSIYNSSCNMKESEYEKASKLIKNKNITLIGMGEGAIIKSPQLSDCIIKSI